MEFFLIYLLRIFFLIKKVITKKNATENKCKILVVNVPNEMDFDMIQLVFESTRILGQGSFDIVNHEEIFNSSENRNVRDIMLEYSNESGKTIAFFLNVLYKIIKAILRL